MLRHDYKSAPFNKSDRLRLLCNLYTTFFFIFISLKLSCICQKKPFFFYPQRYKTLSSRHGKQKRSPQTRRIASVPPAWCAPRPPLKPAARARWLLPFHFLCTLLRYDNVAVRYITAAHGVHHSGRHFMLHNHPICISLCIKVLVHGLVKSALPHYQKIAAEGKNALKEL